MEPQELHWQPGSDEWHGDWETDDSTLEFDYEDDVNSSQSREPWYRTF